MARSEVFLRKQLLHWLNILQQFLLRVLMLQKHPSKRDVSSHSYSLAADVYYSADSANERRRYKVTPSPNGWAQA